jgi:uncharacterized Zn-binding protein involved in type VI secretion
MRLMRMSLLAGALFSSTSGLADDATTPRAIVGGSPDVMVGGRAAARQGDLSGAAEAGVEGSPNVMINGKPALVAGSRIPCGGGVATGSAPVFVNGKPLASRGDVASACAK